MKKTIVILLCLALLFGMMSMLSGCAEKEEEGTSGLMIGYGRGDITPEGPVPMKGYGNPASRLVQSVRDPLYSSCIAVTTADGNQFLLYSMDLCSFPGWEFTRVRKRLSEELGIPLKNIMGACTHNHFGPDFDIVLENNAYIDPYKDKFVENTIQAGRDAWNDMKPATMEYGSKEVVGLNFVRHYIMDDGSINAGNYTGAGTVYVSHVSDVDEELQVLLFRREGAEPVVMVNWQGHPQEYYWEGNGADPVITADVVGATRDFVEAQMECKFIYFSGASGNVNTHSFIESENVASGVTDYGVKLGTQVLMALNDLRPMKADSFRYLEQDVPVKDGKSEIKINGFRIGEMAFVGTPFEMFDTTGMYIKENSPFTETFVLYFLNASSIYIPTETAWKYGGYEVDEAVFPCGTAEILADAYVEMLQQLQTDMVGGENNG